MKLSEYLKGRREVEEVEGKVREAEEKFKEAQEQLKQEKEKLRERMKTEKKTAFHKLKPWTRHDLLLLIIVLVLFTTSMFFPRPIATKTEVAEETEATAKIGFFSKLTGFFFKEKVEETKEETTTETTVTECTENWECTGWSACSEAGKQTRTCTDSNNCNTTENKPVEEQTCTYIQPVKPGPRFSLRVEDTDGNPVSSVKVSGSNQYSYRIIVKNLERDGIVCDADKDINGDVVTNFFKNWLVKSLQERVSPTMITGEGKKEIEYTFLCSFEDEKDRTTEKAKLTVEFV